MSKSTQSTKAESTKPQRVLACVLCQQRKIKCDRTFPCINCTRSHSHCVPAATLPSRQRRRRFPERDLLNRIHLYEGLLRDNNIQFESLHKDHSNAKKRSAYPDDDVHGYGNDGDEQRRAIANARPSSSSTAVKSESMGDAKSIWYAMTQRSRSPDDDSSHASIDDIREATVKEAWDEVSQRNDHLLFGSRDTIVDIFTLHPEQGQIFRLWQIYIENVNPLLKVTHIPTLQARIVDATNDIVSVKPVLAALMFSIYCVSILSLTKAECFTLFGISKEVLSKKYQFGCQQALLECGFTRLSDRDSLTALHLYLVSGRPDADPQSLSAMSGVAIRIAQRMGLSNESTYGELGAFEAEMRRRLWWSIMLFDARISEMVDYKISMMNPTWDCRIPLNLSDFDIQVEMKQPPVVQYTCSEALWTVVRSEMGDFIRHSAFHLEFVNPSLKAIAKNVQDNNGSEGSELDALEKMMENKYLKHCNPDLPLHFMTIWITRGYLAKNRLLEHYSRFPRASMQQTDVQRDAAISHAQSMLECDTRLMTSPLAKGFLWFNDHHFPFTGYIQISQDLRMRPMCDHAERTWQIMSENYNARFARLEEYIYAGPLFKMFTKLIFQAWRARQVAFRQSGQPLMIPKVVSDIHETLASITKDADEASIEQLDAISMNAEFSTSMSLDFDGNDMLLSDTGHPTLGFDSNYFDWNPMGWNSTGCGDI